MNYVLFAVTIFIAISIIVLAVYIARVKIASADTIIPVQNLAFGLFKQNSNEVAERNVTMSIVPSFVSQDTYKSLDPLTQQEKVKRDYMYLFDMALKVYVPTLTLDMLTQQEKYIGILVFAKYVIDYDVYIRRVQDKDLARPDVDVKIKDFFNSVAKMYDNNRSYIDYIIFDKYKPKVAQEMTSDVCARFAVAPGVQQEAVHVQQKSAGAPPVSAKAPLASAGAQQVSTQGAPPVSAKAPLASAANYAIMPSSDRNNAVVQDFLKFLKNAIDAIETNKTQFHQLLTTRTTDYEFLNIYTFVPVLQYAKYVEDNKDLIAANYETLALHQLTITPDTQTFITIASNLYLTNPEQVNQALA